MPERRLLCPVISATLTTLVLLLQAPPGVIPLPSDLTTAPLPERGVTFKHSSSKLKRILSTCVSRHCLDFLGNPGRQVAELVLKGHVRNWLALTIRAGRTSPPAQEQAHRPPPASCCRSLPQEQQALHPAHSHYRSLPINKLHFFRKLKSLHKQNTTLRLPYRRNCSESQVNLQGSPSARCAAIHQVEVSTALQKPCLGQQLPHDIPHPCLCSVPWPKPSAPTGHSVTETYVLIAAATEGWVSSCICRHWPSSTSTVQPPDS